MTTHPQHPLQQLQDPSLLRSHALIDGVWVDHHDRFDVTDPATGETLASVANLTAQHAEQAIAAAQQAWPAWRALSAKVRSQLLRAWFDLVMAHAQDLATIMTAEQGKPLAESQAEVAYGASFIEWYAEQAKRIHGETLQSFSSQRRMLVLRQPIGVCAAITPWNFPLAMITRKVAPALAAGCPVIIKPAEATPLTALALAQLALRAGIPAGVLHVLTADGQQSVAIGKALCANPTVRHLSFTGSTEVGRILMEQSAPSIKKLSLELGGNAPFIVFEDADLDSAVEGAFASKFRNTGQTCVCTNRFYVHESIYDPFVERLTAKVAQARVGNGFDKTNTQGPLIHAAARDKVIAHIADAQAKGARIAIGGKAITTAGAGCFFEPTVLTHVTPDMLCTQEETFGPLAPILKFSTEQEVITAANDTPFGLASYLYSRDMARIFRVSEALEYGMVGVNTGLISSEQAPFGGVKQSGLGREGSQHGIDEYLEMKYICIGDIEK